MSTRIQTDQVCEHVVVDAKTGDNRTITIEPDRHGMTIRFEGFEEELIIDFSDGVFSVYQYLDELTERVRTIGGRVHHIVG